MCRVGSENMFHNQINQKPTEQQHTPLFLPVHISSRTHQHTQEHSRSLFLTGMIFTTLYGQIPEETLETRVFCEHFISSC